MGTLPLKDIVDVVVNISPASTVRSGYNLGLIIGKSTIISAVTRVVEYASLEEMKAGGWLGTEAEYLAAMLYFGQSPRPSKVAIGRWDGTGAETAVQAITACRLANYSWYACYITNAAKVDVISAAAYVESCSPSSVLFYTTSDAEVKTNTAGNVFLTLQASKYRRSIGQYSTIPHAAAAIMGYAMGANSGLPNSAYTLAYKLEVGVAPEPLTSAELVSMKAANGNAYISRGNSYTLFEQGVMASGVPFDEVLYLDILANDIQSNVLGALTSVTKIPQTESGVGVLIVAITDALNRAVNTGFVAPGVWKAPTLGKLNTGDMLAKGYTIMVESIMSQSQADRDARKAPPITIAVKLSGAIEHVAITLNVNR